MKKVTPEHERIAEKDRKEKDWLKWGPYLSERQWGTVREDYSADGSAWEYFPHDHARSRAYRWGEDGIAGFSDKYCNICFGIGLWNGRDPILKERLFGLTGHQGNHGEDVKELYYYLDNTPTHSYMKHLYKYPQNEFPYERLITENANRDRQELEFELLDTGIFEKNEYFDVYTEYAKGDIDDILVKITVVNRNSEAAEVTVLPTLWIRNFWSFKERSEKPIIKRQLQNERPFVAIDHHHIGKYNLYFDEASELLFTENETNSKRIFDDENDHPYKKDLFHEAVIRNDFKLATESDSGTKFSPLYKLNLNAGESAVIKLRLTDQTLGDPFASEFDDILETREKEADSFYKGYSKGVDLETAAIQRQAFAGLLWTKQYYNYEVEPWLYGDTKQPKPPMERLSGRNSQWKTLRNHDVLLMPDAWEYPWYASWDSAFHCATYALLDPTFAKEQLLLFTKEWYMAPNGQIPAYEWDFSNVNPPVQAWSAIHIYQTDKKLTGKGDIVFLKRMFNKLALNFSWWVNQEDHSNNNVFQGGFLGLDNIGVFDRSRDLPGGGHLEQVDGTSWMAMYCLNMLEMSLEISMGDRAFEDMAIKYFGHFVFIAEALNKRDQEYEGTWDEDEGFFFDQLVLPDGRYAPIKVRSISGLLSLAAVLSINKETLERLPRFRNSVSWFKKYRMDNLKYPVVQEFEDGSDLLLSLVPRERMKRLIRTILDEGEFLSSYGIRSLSKRHQNPYHIDIDGVSYDIDYEPGESTTFLFGGNSNWRGPVWFPMNYLFIKSIQMYHEYCGVEMMFEFPTGSSNKMNLGKIGLELGKRLIKIFQRDHDGNRPVNALHQGKYTDEHFKDHILFYEYFHGDNGRGMGASHQTGWTALVANLIANMDMSD